MTHDPRDLEPSLIELADALAFGSAARGGDPVERALAHPALDSELRRGLREEPEVRAELRRACTRVELLRSLDREAAPRLLDRRLERTLAGGRDSDAGVRAASSLGLLGGERAPAELDGLVVAALNAGHRQERATRHVREDLRPVVAPADLERSIASEPARTAGATRTAGGERLGSVPAARARRVPRRLELVGGLAVAAALLVLLDPFGARSAGPASPRPMRLDFEVVRVTPAEMDGLELAFADGFTGGLASLLRQRTDPARPDRSYDDSERLDGGGRPARREGER